MKNNRYEILIVDDIIENIEVLGSVLQEAGYSISFATDAKKALALVENKQFDLFLLDIMMPEIDGFKLCRFLKLDRRTQDIPVIFITARNSVDDIVKGLEVGGVDYVTKPFNALELLSRIKTHLKLKTALEELKQANDTKNKFFSIIAHDLNNPVAALLMNAEMQHLNYDNHTPEERRQMSSEMYYSAIRLSELVDNLLDWSRTQLNRIEFRPQTFNLARFIKENMDHIRLSLERKAIQLNLELDENSSMTADTGMLGTVLRNLVSNAVKFTPRGGEIQLEVENNGNETVFSVQDNGVGINQDDVGKLFRIDVQHKTKGTENEKGTGLGLVLCREFVEKHGGRIWVESSPGTGSRFSFSIPNLSGMTQGG